MNVALRSGRTLDLISLCTGGGGLDLAVELAIPDARSVLMVEREAFAVGHLVAAMEAGLLAPAPVWSDVRTLDGRRWRGLVDGVSGGIPCQPHSFAGRKQGSLDERDLWSDARRIIVQSRAWFVLVENVAGMLSAGDDDVAGAERVWRDLRRLGFAVEAGLFSAAEIGAPHERERIFILGIHDGLADAGCGDFERRGGTEDISRSSGAAEGQGDQRQRNGPPIGDGGEDVADACRAGFQGRERRGSSGERDGSAAHGSVAEFRQISVVDTEVARSRPIHTGQRRSGQAAALADRPGLFPPGPGDLDAWRRVLDDSSDLEPAVRRMADGLAARMDLSGPHAGDSFRWHAARVERLRMLGNGVVPLQGGYAIRTLLARLAARGCAAATRLVRMSAP